MGALVGHHPVKQYNYCKIDLFCFPLAAYSFTTLSSIDVLEDLKFLLRQ